MKRTRAASRRVAVLAAAFFLVALPINARAGVYLWEGNVDGNWDTPANWNVTGSIYTWPNEQHGNEYTNEDADAIRIINGDTVARATHLSVDGARDGSNTAHLTLDNASTLAITDGNSMWAADWGGTRSQVDVLGGSVLDVAHDLKIGDDNGSIATLNIVGSTVIVGDDLIIANRAGSTAFLNISGNSTITVADRFYMNDGPGSGATSKVVMDDGVVNVAGNSYFNDDAESGSTATFIMNGGSWTSGEDIDISWNLDATSHLTINGGQMIAGDDIRFGVSGGSDTGESRVFLNGGLFQGEELFFTMSDSMLVFVGGEFRINQASVTEAAMQNLIDTGKIDVSGAPGHLIFTDGVYTVLVVPEPATLALLGTAGLALLRRRRAA